MAHKYAGKVAVHGIDGKIAFTGLLATENILEDSEGADELEVDEFTDGDGYVVGLAGEKPIRRETFTIVPFDPSNPSTVATARTKIKYPPPFATITVSGFGTSPNQIPDLVGDWTYMGGGTRRLGKGTRVRLTLPVARFGTAAGTFTALPPVT
jgi:hypothetical protein